MEGRKIPLLGHEISAGSRYLCWVTRSLIGHEIFDGSRDLWWVTRSLMGHEISAGSRDLWWVTRNLMGHEIFDGLRGFWWFTRWSFVGRKIIFAGSRYKNFVGPQDDFSWAITLLLLGREKRSSLGLKKIFLGRNMIFAGSQYYLFWAAKWFQLGREKKSLPKRKMIFPRPVYYLAGSREEIFVRPRDDFSLAAIWYLMGQLHTQSIYLACRSWQCSEFFYGLNNIIYNERSRLRRHSHR